MGVSYSDAEDPISDLVLDIDRAVDINRTGIYEVTYTVTDTDGNQTTAVGRVLVNDGNWSVGKDYLIYAHGFTVDYAAATGTHDEIISLSGAKAYSKDTLTEIPVTVVSDGNYQKFPGSYPAIKLAPEAEQTTIRTITGVITGGTWTVSFDPNGGKLLGPAYLNVLGSGSTLPFMPQNPERDGYKFVSWNTQRNGGGSYFDATTPISGNVTVYAQWEKIPDPPAPAPAPAPVYPPANGPTYITNPTYVTVNNPPAAAPIVNVEQPEATAAPQVVQPQEIQHLPAPTAVTDPITWSLLDLLLTIATGLLLVFYVVKFFIDRKKDKDLEEEDVDWRADTKQRSFRVSLPVLVIGLIGLIEALIILFATQDFDTTMALVDQYTVIFSVILFVLLVIPVILAMRHNQKETELYQQMQYQQQILRQQQLQDGFQQQKSVTL
jgi:uncharacterized repeat protein (TIGR02543 family)